jgi:hypothetical protein
MLASKKTQILGVWKVLGLPCSFFFSVITPLYRVHLHCFYYFVFVFYPKLSLEPSPRPSIPHLPLDLLNETCIFEAMEKKRSTGVGSFSEAL